MYKNVKSKRDLTPPPEAHVWKYPHMEGPTHHLGSDPVEIRCVQAFKHSNKVLIALSVS